MNKLRKKMVPVIAGFAALAILIPLALSTALSSGI